MPCRCGRLVAGLLFVAAALTAGRWLGRTVRRRFGMPPRRPELRPADATDVVLNGANSRTLRGWLFSSGRSRSPAVVVMHGWGASARDMLPTARVLADAGLHALVIDARCHGRSDNDDFASMPRFAEDVEAAVAWLRRQSYVDPDRIALLGHSVGAGACLLAASRDPHITGVVSVSSMAHPAQFMHATLVRHGVPRILASGALRYVEHVIGHRYDDLAPVRTIRDIHVPVLLVHGEADATVPVSDARQLQEARPTLTRMVVVPDTGHNDLEALQSVADQVVAFLQATMGSGIR